MENWHWFSPLAQIIEDTLHLDDWASGKPQHPRFTEEENRSTQITIPYNTIAAKWPNCFCDHTFIWASKYHVIEATDGKIKIPKGAASCQRYPQMISSLKQMKTQGNVRIIQTSQRSSDLSSFQYLSSNLFSGISGNKVKLDMNLYFVD